MAAAIRSAPPAFWQEAIRHTGTYDLVLAGDVSSDGATGQVGAMVAELLGLPCASDARRIDLEGDKLTVLRNWKSQKVRVRIALPCMVTVGLAATRRFSRRFARR